MITVVAEFLPSLLGSSTTLCGKLLPESVILLYCELSVFDAASLIAFENISVRLYENESTASLPTR